MRVGWLADPGNADGSPGGAELTMGEFAAAAPDGVEVVPCPPGGVAEWLDVYVVGNCVSYSPDDFDVVCGPTFKYWHDVGPHVPPQVRDWIDENAVQVYCSPLQAERMGAPAGQIVPPALDLEPFRQAAEANGETRTGAVSVGAWMNPGKAPHRVLEFRPDVDFFGGGPYAPQGSVRVERDELPGLLARYKTFVYLPTALEPFGRTVAEAWAAGCGLVTNRLVGASWWIEHAPDRLETAADDFWDLVTA